MKRGSDMPSLPGVPNIPPANPPLAPTANRSMDGIYGNPVNNVTVNNAVARTTVSTAPASGGGGGTSPILIPVIVGLAAGIVIIGAALAYMYKVRRNRKDQETFEALQI
jgi:hypothetical protein